MVFCNNKQWFRKSGAKQGHNPYFNRWFSAIALANCEFSTFEGHNPYFNRWFSAILCMITFLIISFKVTILILIDGFLQCLNMDSAKELRMKSQSLF